MAEVSSFEIECAVNARRYIAQAIGMVLWAKGMLQEATKWQGSQELGRAIETLEKMEPRLNYASNRAVVWLNEVCAPELPLGQG